MRVFVILALACGLFCATQEEQNEIWRKALEDSKRAADRGPVNAPASRQPTPEENQAAREREAERLRDEQAELRKQREERERVAEQARIKRAEEAEREWKATQERMAADRAAQQERQAEAMRAAEAEQERKRQEEASRARWAAVFGVFAVVIALCVAVLPSIIAAVRGSDQRPAIAGLVLCSILGGAISASYPVAAPAPLLTWAAALALSLWRFRQAAATARS